MIVLKKLFISNRGHSVSKAAKVIHLKVRNMTTSSSFESVKERLKSGFYSLYNVPSVLFMDPTGVFVNENVPYPDIVKELESTKMGAPEKKNVLTPKLKASSYGDWYSRVVMMHSRYFESREDLNEILIKTSDREVGSQCITADRISLRNALKAMKVDLSINMDYYLQNKSEIDIELNCNISNSLELNNELVKRKLEEQLFYKTMCNLFGKENADDHDEVDGKEALYEKSYVIRDFNILSFDGNSMLATGARDDYYLLFFFDY